MEVGTAVSSLVAGLAVDDMSCSSSEDSFPMLNVLSGVQPGGLLLDILTIINNYYYKMIMNKHVSFQAYTMQPKIQFKSLTLGSYDLSGFRGSTER